MKGASFRMPGGASHKIAMPRAPKIHPAASRTQVRFPDAGAVGAAPAVQTPVGRI